MFHELTFALFVRHVLHPIDEFAVFLLLNRDMGHRRGRSRSVPVPFIWREPDHISRMDLLYPPAFALCPAAARRHDQRLTERVRMPGSSRTWLERHARARNQRGVRRSKERINANRPRKPV